MIALLDTHVLLWWFESPRRLSGAQRRVLAKTSTGGHAVGVSDITLWEIAVLLERRRIRLALPLDEWLRRATAAPRVERVGISPAIVREMIDLGTTRDWDPADRVLVASARVLGVPLVSADERIASSGLVSVV